MTAADHAAVGRIGFAAWAASEAFDESYSNPDVIARVEREFAIFPGEGGAEIHVAALAGELVGWCARETRPNYISDLWVSPAHQGKGIGRSLLLHLCNLIAAEGHATARLDTHARNARAIRLYEGCGFDIVWRGTEFSKSMGVDLEKVHLEKPLVGA